MPSSRTTTALVAGAFPLLALHAACSSSTSGARSEDASSTDASSDAPIEAGTSTDASGSDGPAAGGAAAVSSGGVFGGGGVHATSAGGRRDVDAATDASDAAGAAILCTKDEECSDGQLCGTAELLHCGPCTADTQCTNAVPYGKGFWCVDGRCTGTPDPKPCTDCPVLPAVEFKIAGMQQNGGVPRQSGILSDGSLFGQSPLPAGQNFVAVDVGKDTWAALTKEGEVRACYYDGVTFLGDPPLQNCGNTFNVVSDGAGPFALSGVVAVSVGDRHFCALLEDGYPRCWGDNAFGQLGDGTTTTRSVPTRVNLPDQRYIGAGGYSTCSIGKDGALSCWGWITAPLGSNAPAGSPVPVPIPDPGTGGFIAVDVSEIRNGEIPHACALKADHSVWCWGNNDSGQVGNGSEGVRVDVPTRVLGVSGNGYLSAVAITTGWKDACAILPNGHVACWGNGGYGSLGTGLRESSNVPTEVTLFDGATRISAAIGPTCAVRTDGSVWCWGGPIPRAGNPDPTVPSRVR